MARMIEKREANDCVWIERPFVAENVGADQRRIDGTLGLGRIPGNLDHLRVEAKKKNKRKAKRDKRSEEWMSFVQSSRSDKERKKGGGRSNRKRGREEGGKKEGGERKERRRERGEGGEREWGGRKGGKLKKKEEKLKDERKKERKKDFPDR